jgi:hypothetical protein
MKENIGEYPDLLYHPPRYLAHSPTREGSNCHNNLGTGPGPRANLGQGWDEDQDCGPA